MAKCKYCGAEKDFGEALFFSFACGTSYVGTDSDEIRTTKCYERQIEHLQKRCDKSEARVWRLEEQLACACDKLNCWCREAGSHECENPYELLELRETIGLLWAKLSTAAIAAAWEAQRKEQGNG